MKDMDCNGWILAFDFGRHHSASCGARSDAAPVGHELFVTPHGPD